MPPLKISVTDRAVKKALVDHGSFLLGAAFSPCLFYWLVFAAIQTTRPELLSILFCAAALVQHVGFTATTRSSASCRNKLTLHFALTPHRDKSFFLLLTLTFFKTIFPDRHRKTLSIPLPILPSPPAHPLNPLPSQRGSFVSSASPAFPPWLPFSMPPCLTLFLLLISTTYFLVRRSMT